MQFQDNGVREPLLKAILEENGECKMMTLKYLKLWRWKLDCRLWRVECPVQGKWKSSLI
jgi:hypothetical protein